MKRSRDPLALSPHWHVDCRLEAELPEDNVVGTRFLINVAFTAVALTAFLFAGYFGYLDLNLRRQIQDAEQRIKENRAEVAELKRMQQEYAVEAAKIDQAYTLVRPTFFVTGLIADFGRTRLEPVVFDLVEWNDAGVFVRGNVRETPERATRLIGGYVEQLGRDDKIGPLFREVVLNDLVRGAPGDPIKFEILLRLKPVRP